MSTENAKLKDALIVTHYTLVTQQQAVNVAIGKQVHKLNLKVLLVGITAYFPNAR